MRFISRYTIINPLTLNHSLMLHPSEKIVYNKLDAVLMHLLLASQMQEEACFHTKQEILKTCRHQNLFLQASQRHVPQLKSNQASSDVKPFLLDVNRWWSFHTFAVRESHFRVILKFHQLIKAKKYGFISFGCFHEKTINAFMDSLDDHKFSKCLFAASLI